MDLHPLVHLPEQSTCNQAMEQFISRRTVRGFSLLDLQLIGAFQLFQEEAISDRFPPFFRAVTNLVQRGVRLTSSFHFSRNIERGKHNENPTRMQRRASNSATAIEKAHRNLLRWVYNIMENYLKFKHFSHSDFVDCFLQLLHAGRAFLHFHHSFIPICSIFIYFQIIRSVLLLTSC